MYVCICIYIYIKVKWSRYRPGVAQRVGRGKALLFHDRGTRREWVVSSTPRPNFTPGKDPAPILRETEWAPGLIWTGGKSRPNRDSIPDRSARSQPLFGLSYPEHIYIYIYIYAHSLVILPISGFTVWHMPFAVWQSWSPDDGRKDRPKYVECHSKIKKNEINLIHWCI